MSGAVEGIASAGNAGWRGGGHLVRLRPLGQDEEARRLVDLVAEARGVPSLLLLHPSRCSAGVAKARQLAMYLMHVILRRNYADVGAFFGRDRTTVSHACAQIEDLRDRPRFDAEVERLESALKDGDRPSRRRWSRAAR